MCTQRGRPPVEAGSGAWSDYCYNNYLNDPEQAAKPNAADRKRKFVEVTDGTSNTIMVGQGSISTTQYTSNANVKLSTNIFLGGTNGTMRAGHNGKTAPTGVTLKRDSTDLPGVGSWGGPFPQGSFMCMGDGTVRMFPYNTANLGSFLTPTGDEAVTLPD